MKTWFADLTAVSLVLLSANAWPQTLDIRTGIWEGTMSSQESARPQLDASKMDLSGLSAEQRARVEEVIKRQQAQHAAEGDGPRNKSRVNKFCITKEKLDKRDFAEMGPGKGDTNTTCNQELLANTSAQLHLKMVCSGQSPGTVEVTYQVVNKELMNTTFSMEAMRGTHPYSNKGAGTARWIAADCGNIK